MPFQPFTAPASTTRGREPASLDFPAVQPPSEPWPLTRTQEWLRGSDSDPVVARHWEQAVWSNVSIARLQRAVALIALRHPLVHVLLVDDTRQGLAAMGAESLLRLTDATHLEETERRRCLAAERDQLCLAPDGRLVLAWQVHALLTAGDTAVITVCFARQFFDRASTRRILDDLYAAYHDSSHGGLPDPSDIELFRAYTAVCRTRNDRPTASAKLNLPPGPDLPVTGSTDARSAPALARCTVRLGAETWTALQANFADTVRAATREALIGATCGSVLARWCRHKSFAVQFTVDDRASHAIPPDATGQFTRLVLTPVDDSARQTFAGRVADFHRGLEAAAAAPLPADGDGLPLVAVSTWFTAERARSEPPHDSDHFVFVGTSRPGVVLEFHAEETGEGGLVVHLDFRRDHFPADLVPDLAQSLQTWLHRLAEDHAAWQLSPAGQAETILPATQRERRRAFNATAAPVSTDLLCSGFLRRCSTAREAIAIVTPQRSLTYAELYGYACRLAVEIRHRGIGRNELVAIAAEKGWEQIAAAVGITLAGAAYLPVDLDLPESRIRHLITCGEARLVVTQSHHAQTLPVPPGVAVIALDTLEPVAPDTPPPACDAGPDDLAYVIFTSGSTGTPKGVMIDHRGALNTINDMNTRFGVRAGDRVFALSRLSFDLSVYDIFGLLAAGGSIVLPAPDLARDPAHWAGIVRQHRVTIWNTVPALMQLLVDHAAETATTLGPSLRHVWLSGDWIPLPLPARIKGLVPGVEVTSLGGATEASIWSILYPILHVDPAWRSIPYGRPMVNQTFHVLDADLAPCPDHVQGELFIGGIGVARGYWKDAEKTNARFLHHPRTGERLYRTGDLGRFLPDGNIEFLGRADFQVKIRGFRIELGEIEVALAAEPRVRAAVVVAQGDSDADRQLVAYVVREGRNPVTAEELQDFLRRRLASYMVPTAILFLEHLPLTTNGKVDLKALPAPSRGDAAPPSPPAEPTSEIETVLRDIWQPLLRCSHVGIHDDFFALGGNSLTGTRMILRVREAFQLRVAVESLYAHPTIHRLGRLVESLLLAELTTTEATAASDDAHR